MAYLAPNSFASNMQYLEQGAKDPNATGQIDLSQVSDSGSGGAQGSQVASAPAPAAGSPTAPKAAPQTSLAPSREGSIQERLFNPMAGQLGASGEAAKGAKEAFYKDAGPSHSFGAQEQQAIQGVAQGSQQAPGSSDYSQYQKNYDSAKSYVTANYGGPSGLDDSKVASFNNQMADTKAYNKALQTGSGLDTLSRMAAPGLSSGEARFQAKALVGDQEFQAKAREAAGQQEQLQGAWDTAYGQAQDYATQRTAEENAFRTQAQDYAKGFQTQAMAPITQAMDEAAAKRAQIKAAYEGISQGTDIPTEYQNADVQGMYGSQARKESADAEIVYKGIIDKYPDLKDVPILTPTTAKDYALHWAPPPEWIKANPGRWEQVKKQARARQKELETAFGVTDKKNPSLYGKYKPLTMGGDANLLDTEVPTWKPQGVKDYTSMDEGSAISRENFASEQQKTTYNNIANLLDQADQMGQVEPFRQAQILGDVQQYLADEAANLKQRQDIPRAQWQEFKKIQSKLERAFNKAQSKSITGRFKSFSDPGKWASMENVGSMMQMGMDSPKMAMDMAQNEAQMPFQMLSNPDPGSMYEQKRSEMLDRLYPQRKIKKKLNWQDYVKELPEGANYV